MNGRGGRVAAAARGRLFGADEARRRGEVGGKRDRRIARAVAYAEWEYDTMAERKRTIRTVSSEGAVT